MLPILFSYQARYSLFVSVSTLVIAFALSGCGSNLDEIKVKEFKLTVVNTADDTIKNTFRRLVDDYNIEAGIRVLTYVDTEEQANSAIVITSGLQKRDGKVGWGQPLAEVDEQRLLDDLSGVKVKRTTRHFMRVEFDEDYVRSRMDSAEEDDKYDLKKLFSHEVGHGLEMGHDINNKSNLMYPDISGTKDFTAYFNSVRTYFN